MGPVLAGHGGAVVYAGGKSLPWFWWPEDEWTTQAKTVISTRGNPRCSGNR